MSTALLVFILAIAFVVIDLVWFQVAGGFFKQEIGSIARLTPEGEWQVRLLPAIIAYLLMAVGIVFLVLPLATSLPHALLMGALFGLVGYGLYDLTNLATLTAWTTKFAVVDMTWGMVLCGAVASLGYWLMQTSFFA